MQKLIQKGEFILRVIFIRAFTPHGLGHCIERQKYCQRGRSLCRHAMFPSSSLSAADWNEFGQEPARYASKPLPMSIMGHFTNTEIFL